ncbi:hypothetical protein JXD20_03060 [Candidatus Peregrinibacteria bacterium]|nr:hypothetical protein [Candidatus Peregrinibacteria bacterium]
MTFKFFSKKVATLLITIIYLSTVLLNGVPFAYAQEEKVYYFLTDHLGSVDKVLDEDSNVVCDKDYLPYGDTRIEDCTGEDEDYGFTGKEKDDETGLHYYGARYYDSTTGRFVSPDPLLLRIDQMSPEERNQFLSDPQALNAYAYARNNPVRYIDPDGESFTEWALWQAGSAYLMTQGNYTAAYFLNHSINNVPFFGDYRSSQPTLNFSDSNNDKMSQRITTQIRGSEAYSRNIDHIKAKLLNGNLTGDGSDTFYSSDNEDLFLAIKSYSYTYQANQNDDGSYNVNIRIEDNYDFKREDYDSFLNTVNNAAEMSQKTKALLPYHISIEMKETIKIDDKDEENN